MCRNEKKNIIAITHLKIFQPSLFNISPKFEKREKFFEMFTLTKVLMSLNVALMSESVCLLCRIQQESLSWLRLWVMGHMGRCTR